MKKLLVLLAATIAASCVLFGCSKEPEKTVEYTVTFRSNLGSSIPAITVKEGDSITLPTPTRTGYMFDGWYSSSSGGFKYGDGGTVYVVHNDVTMQAQWTKTYTITFKYSTGVVIYKITVEYGETIALPSATNAGHTFDGWWTTPQYSVTAQNGIYVGSYSDLYTHYDEDDITLWARWK